MEEFYQPEEIEEIPEEVSDPQENIDLDHKADMVRRITSIGLLFGIVTIIDSVIQFQTYQAWQILADAAGILIGIILLLVIRRLTNKHATSQVESLLPWVIFFMYAPGDIFLQGVTAYNIISGLMLLFLGGILIRLNNTRWWITFAFLYSGFILFANQNPFIQRFDISVSPSLQLFLPLITGLVGIALVWQLAKLLMEATLRIRLIITFLVIGLTPVAVLAITSSVQGIRTSREQTNNNLSLITENKEIAINSWLESLNGSFSPLFTDSLSSYLIDELFHIQVGSVSSISPPSIKELENISPTHLLENMHQIVSSSSLLENLFLMDINGNVILTTDSSLVNRNLSSKAFFLQGFSGSAEISKPTLNSSGYLEIFFAQPIINHAGLTVSVLAGQVNPTPLHEIMGNWNGLGESGEAYLVNRDMIALTKSRNFTADEATMVMTEGIQETLQKFTLSRGNYLNYQAEQVIGAYKWLPQLDSVLVIEQSSSEVNNNLRLFLLLNSTVGILTVIIAIITAIYINQSIANPLSYLARKAAQFTAGDFNVIEPIQRGDEIGELSQSLYLMTSQLKESFLGLETMVAERTQELEKRANYLKSAAEVGRAATEKHKLEDLLSTITHLISQKFGFYHVGIFLIDESREYAVLRSANSEGGWRMLARGHKLRVGEEGIVGHVTESGEPSIQQKVSTGGLYFDNPDLPHTKSEMALPLEVNGKMLGALDVQSTEENAFSSDDVDALQVLADQVAMAIYNTQLLEQLQETIEIERRAFGEISRQGWKALLKKKESGYKSTPAGIIPTDNQPEQIGKEALSSGRIVVGDKPLPGSGYPLAIPIKIAGDFPIAVLETSKPTKNGPWTNNEIEFLESIIEQISVTLENARLFEETQRLANRERIVADVAGKVWASQDVDSILQTTVQELGRALNASSGNIRLSLPEDEK